MKDETPAPQLGLDAPFMNKVGRRKGKGESEDTTLPTSSFLHSPSPILDAFAKDTGPAAEAIKELLKTIESGGDAKAEAAALIEKLPDLMPEDPAMSAVIAEEMAKQFGDADGRGGVPPPSAGDGRAARPAQPLANKEDAIALANKRGECRAKDPAHCPMHGTPMQKVDTQDAEEEEKKKEEAKAKRVANHPKARRPLKKRF